MRFGTVFAVVGMMLAIVGGVMVVPALYGLFAGEKEWSSIAVAALLTLISGIALRINCRARPLTSKDSFGVVGFGWLATAAFGALPFIFTLPEIGVIDCLFESVSGVTTTGATILNADHVDPESGYFMLPKCVLLWRSMLQWIGGLGVIMMVLVLLPFMEGSGLQILRAEVTVVSQKIRPKMRDTGMMMAGIYLLLTFLDMVLLHIAGMNVFDSVCHAFSTLSTGPRTGSH